MKKLRLLNTSEYLTEQSLRRALEGTTFRVFAQLPLNKVIQLEKSDRISRSESKFLQDSELDFVIYNQDSLPELAIEFDGPAHRAYERKKRSDIKKNRLCRMAGLPLIRVGDIHLEQHDKTTLLEYMINRFVSWHTEIDGILAEINEYLSMISEEEFEQLTEGGILDPEIDPTFIFNLRHPFPASAEIAKRLYAEHRIVSSRLEPKVWDRAMKQPRALSFSYCGSESDYNAHYIVKDRDYELRKIVRKAGGRTDTNVMHKVQVTFRIQWTLPLVEDYDRDETQLQYYLKTGRFPVVYQDIPGISMPELAENFCEYLALRQVEEWAKKNLPTALDS